MLRRATKEMPMFVRTALHATLDTGERYRVTKTNLSGMQNSDTRTHVITVEAISDYAFERLYPTPQEIPIEEAVRQILGFQLITQRIDTQPDKSVVRVELSYEVQRPYPNKKVWKEFMRTTLDALVT